jgi:hypothetical protein
MQAQEYEHAKWAIGLRMRDGAPDAAVERAFEEGRILRTHVMRPTWHFVTPADIRWLLELTAPRVHRVMAPYNRRLGLDGALLTRGTTIVARALRDRHYLTRRELGERLRRAGLPLDGMRLAHLAMHAELEGVICSGPRRGRQFTYALLAERAPGARRLPRDESLAVLSRRYFASHGPATVRDFAWWSGLTMADARRALEMHRARREEIGGLTYWTIGARPGRATRERLVQLLPIYDEFLVAYRDRQAVSHGPSRVSGSPRAFVTFRHALVIDGQVAGTWLTKRLSKAMQVEVIPMRRLTGRERRAVGETVKQYEQFLGVPVALSDSR